MGNKKNRRSRRVETQSSDRDENTSETSFTQGKATLVEVSDNVNNIFDRNEGSELTQLSQINIELKAITQRLSEKNSHKMTQIEQQLNSKFKDILKKSEQIEKATWQMMKKMPRTIGVALQIQKRNSGEDTHQTRNLMKTEIRIIAFSPQKCMN